MRAKLPHLFAAVGILISYAVTFAFGCLLGEVVAPMDKISGKRSAFVVRDLVFLTVDTEEGGKLKIPIAPGSELFIPCVQTTLGKESWLTVQTEGSFLTPEGHAIYFRQGDRLELPEYAMKGGMAPPENGSVICPQVPEFKRLDTPPPPPAIDASMHVVPGTFYANANSLAQQILEVLGDDPREATPKPPVVPD